MGIPWLFSVMILFLHSPRVFSSQNSQLVYSKMQNGDIVRVKVLDFDKKSFYSAEIAGEKLFVKSQQPLSVGDTFSARLKLSENGEILLIPIPDSEVLDSNADKNAHLLREGLIPDKISETLLQYFKQSSLFFDKKILENLRFTSRAFAEKECLAAEAGAILLQSGLPSDESAVKSLFDEILAFLFAAASFSRVAEKTGEQNKKENFQFKEKLSSLNPLFRLYTRVPIEKQSILTLVNQLSRQNKHWVFFPFEWNENFFAKGMIRALLNLQASVVEKILVYCKTSRTDYFFVLQFSFGSVQKVLFYTEPEFLGKNAKSQSVILENFLNCALKNPSAKPIRAIYDVAAKCEGICVTNEKPFFVEELV